MHSLVWLEHRPLKWRRDRNRCWQAAWGNVPYDLVCHANEPTPDPWVVVQLLSCVRPFVTPWTIARQAFLSFTISLSLPKLISIESVMPSNHLILCHPLLLLFSMFPSIRVFPMSWLSIRWPKYWSFSFNISPSSEYSGLISFRLTGLISLQSKGFSRVFSSTTIWKNQLFGALPSLW